MSLGKFAILWLILSAFMGWEYLALNGKVGFSLLTYMQARHWIPNFPLTTEAGRTISYQLGWLGIGTMLLTNIYIIRKRLMFMSRWGNLENWLNFHIFCGLMGPTFILFHSDFKVRGVVGLSFWSMIIVATSGVLGRYFYVQVARFMAGRERAANAWLKKLDGYVDGLGSAKISLEEMERIKEKALQFVGVPVVRDEHAMPNILMMLIGSIIGDLRLWFTYPQSHPALPRKSRYVLEKYALEVRSSRFVELFQRLLGYWHAFHIPFTVVMYIAAVIHIISSLLFIVKK